MLTGRAMVTDLSERVTDRLPLFITAIVGLSFVYGAQHGNPLLWIWVLAFFSLLHLVESKFVMPKFLSHRLHLHAAVIIIALLVGGEFFGLMGMFLAAPLAALARTLVVHFIAHSRRETRLAKAAAVAAAPPSGPASGRVLRLERALRSSSSAVAAVPLRPVGTPLVKE